MKKTLILATLTAALSLSFSASALTILSADRYLGESTGTGNNHTMQLNTLIVSHNLSADPLHAIHTTIPTPVGAATAHYLGDDDVGDITDPLFFTLEAGHLWLGYKAGTSLGFYYLGGITAGEMIQFQTNFQQGVSNWSTYAGTVPYNIPVPDSGTTFALFSLGIAGLIGFRRFRR